MAGINLKITTEGWSQGNLAWMKSQYGFDTARPCTLSLAAFVAATLIDGYIPAGIALGKITASGLYGPYTPAAADGTETCVGLLLHDVRKARDADETGTLTVSAAAFVWQGIVDAAKLPVLTSTTQGELDANGKADLPQIRFE
jgi:hypothetical protein